MEGISNAAARFDAELGRLEDYMGYHAEANYQLGLGGKLGGRVGHIASFDEFKRTGLKNNFINIVFRAGHKKTVPAGGGELAELLAENRVYSTQFFSHNRFVSHGFGAITIW